ncbi:hypothetical protein BJ170DRAFT_687339 [Xylariales sp. AK1849]|nr:hypothetical protein BJ170DRAFT_687339 [Xylariales sp. AK1849]
MLDFLLDGNQADGYSGLGDLVDTGGPFDFEQTAFLSIVIKTPQTIQRELKETFDDGNLPTAVSCRETSPGGYNFNAKFWQTSDGCNNIDFEGAFNLGHEWCCGGAPCDLS